VGELAALFQRFDWFSLIDVAIVALIIFGLFYLVRGTQAAPLLRGVIILGVIFGILGSVATLPAISWLFGNALPALLIAIPVIFQPELRRLLTYLGQSRLVRIFMKVVDPRFIEDVVNATAEMSKKNFGALIVMLRDTGIKSIQETGVQLQAQISKPLITAIFNPRSPLHDGALVIRGEIVLAAKCLLPLSQNPDIDPALGTRHRAAIGISEQTDAIVVIVSEETGMISVADDGKIQRGLTGEMLRAKLLEAFAPLPKEKKGWRLAPLSAEQ
jgi:diadenylate cyclase